MKAVFFGSIGSVVETSELQRQAFNAAFQDHGLDWFWSQNRYRDALTSSGGRARIAAFAQANGLDVDASAIHQTKVKMFHEMLKQERMATRPGVAAVIAEAKAHGLTLGFISTTDRRSIDLALTSAPDIGNEPFDLVTSADLGLAQKPNPDVYRYALGALNLDASDVIAIEDNAPGVNAAHAAGIPVVAFPGENTQDQDYAKASRIATVDLKASVFGQ